VSDQGGIDQVSEAKLQLDRRFAAGCVLAEAMEAKMGNGEEIDVAAHCGLSSTLVRLSARIGIDRIPKDVTPTLAEYLAAKAQQHDAEEAEEAVDA
jgi:hypothetical protein